MGMNNNYEAAVDQIMKDARPRPKGTGFLHEECTCPKVKPFDIKDIVDSGSTKVYAHKPCPVHGSPQVIY